MQVEQRNAPARRQFAKPIDDAPPRIARGALERQRALRRPARDRGLPQAFEFCGVDRAPPHNSSRSGQSRHFGARAVQIVAPRSIRAEFQSCARPRGTSSRARASSSRASPHADIRARMRRAARSAVRSYRSARRRDRRQRRGSRPPYTGRRPGSDRSCFDPTAARRRAAPRLPRRAAASVPRASCSRAPSIRARRRPSKHARARAKSGKRSTKASNFGTTRSTCVCAA